MIRSLRLSVCLMLAVGVSHPAYAESTSGVLQMSVAVADSCTFTSAAYSLDLTGYDPILDNAVSSVTNPTFTCSSDGAVNVTTATANTSSTCPNADDHAMLDESGHALCYQLFADAGHTTPLRSTPLRLTVSGNQPVDFPVYGSITQGQRGAFVGATYRDSITITITVDDAVS
jgi:spore coat protein U-like protein